MAMNTKSGCLIALSLLSFCSFAGSDKRDEFVYEEVKRFWVVQLEGGELEVIEQVKSCYAKLRAAPKVQMLEAEQCIIWDIALSELSSSVSQVFGEAKGVPAESLQTRFARKETMRLSVMKLLNQLGLDEHEAASKIDDIGIRISRVFAQAFNEVGKDLGLAESVKQEPASILDEIAAQVDQSANQRNAETNLNLGRKYAEGDGVPQNYATATNLFRLSAEQGNAEAQYNLGISYAKGYGVQKDEHEAFKWFRLAAEQGLSQAQIVVGNIYGHGVLIQQDAVQAAKWIRLAARQGVPDAQNQLGNLYKSGIGVQQDHKEATYWHRQAADQGHVLAQYNLGADYLKGLGVLQDYKEASKWFLLAADKGLADAQLAAGLLFQVGYGVPESRPAAYALFNISSVGNPSSSNPAIERRAALTLLLSAQEIASAQALANEMAKPNNLIKALNQYLVRQSDKKKKNM